MDASRGTTRRGCRCRIESRIWRLHPSSPHPAARDAVSRTHRPSSPSTTRWDDAAKITRRQAAYNTTCTCGVRSSPPEAAGVAPPMSSSSVRPPTSLINPRSPGVPPPPPPDRSTLRILYTPARPTRCDSLEIRSEAGAKYSKERMEASRGGGVMEKNEGPSAVW
jgi:hypothetical protein